MFTKLFKNKNSELLERLCGLDRLDRELLASSFSSDQRAKSLLNSFNKQGLPLIIFQAGANISLKKFFFFSLFFGILTVVLFSKIFSIYFWPLFFGLGSLVPLAYLERKIKHRVNNFAGDYAELLLAMSSSIKVGMTADKALERSIDLFPESSLLKQEVRKLLKYISDGVDRNIAIDHFARSIKLPELELFRSAYLLVLENGGKFSPTLKRLAEVTKDRLSLISSAQVSTASMRMTANFLLCFLPIILFLLSSRTKDYWQLLLHHPQINFFASLGLSMILFGYFTLRKMSNFKP